MAETRAPRRLPSGPRPGQPVADLLPDRPSLPAVREPLAPVVAATVHPSSILRAPDEKTRREELRRFIADLVMIAGTTS